MRRFTIRDLLWLTTLVAMGAAWFADHHRQNDLIKQQKTASAQAAGQVQDEWLRRYQGEAPAR